MSSDASPPGLRLEADPPWLKVIGTTLRLWVRRRVLRVPDRGKIRGARLAALCGAVVIVVAAATGAAVVLSGVMSGPAASSARHVTAPAVTPAQLAAETEAKANGQAAAAWVDAQVNAQTVVGCDLVMCAQLQAAGFRTDVQLAGPAALSQQAVTQDVGVPGAVMLAVITPAVRGEYGMQAIEASAPAVLASFGTGHVSVQVRELVPGDPAAYAGAARAALAARRKAGLSLARSYRVQVQGAARLELVSGQVDPRLTGLLRLIADRYPVHVARFGDSGPLAGHLAPLRMVEIGGFTVRHGHRQVSDLSALLKLLRDHSASYQAQVTMTASGNGTQLLKIEVPAPTPS